MRVLGFAREGIELYLPLHKIKSVLGDETVFRYPEISNRLFGLMFFNGEVVPVVDIKRLLTDDTSFEIVDRYSNRCSVVIAESLKGYLAFVYDELKDIFDIEEIKGATEIKVDSIPIENKSGLFFVENIEILEDVILPIRSDNKNFKEILLCPKRS